MVGTNWDEKCPHCGAAIVVNDYYSRCGREKKFSFDCPQCQEEIKCYVQLVPEFELSVPEKSIVVP